MAGRAEFFRQQKVHAQREVTYEKPAPIDNDSWITEGLDACRTLAAQHGNVWGITEFALLENLNGVEADRRLRYLSKIGVLKMSTERCNGAFVRFTWSMVDPKLPRSTDLN